MLAFIRILLAAIFVVVTTLAALIYCLFSPRDPKHVHVFCRWFNQLHKIVGMTLIQRGAEHAHQNGHAVYVSNHQSVFDFVTSPGMLPPRTVTIGKKKPIVGTILWPVVLDNR